LGANKTGRKKKRLSLQSRLCHENVLSEDNGKERSPAAAEVEEDETKKQRLHTS
jgi:hypothetical protein